MGRIKERKKEKIPIKEYPSEKGGLTPSPPPFLPLENSGIFDSGIFGSPNPESEAQKGKAAIFMK